MKNHTYSHLADDPNYKKLKEPTKSAAKLQDKLIRAQVENLDREINREKLNYEIIKNDIYSSYEPCIYPGVNIKYFIN